MFSGEHGKQFLQEAAIEIGVVPSADDRIPSAFQSISARAAPSARSRAIPANEPLPFAADMQD
jgi:hypothetical protein